MEQLAVRIVGVDYQKMKVQAEEPARRKWKEVEGAKW